MNGSEFVHRFVPGTGPRPSTTLLLLHGTGGNEDDLIPLGQRLLPGAPLLSPRGKVLENGMPRFFRRFGEGRFDVDDLKRQAAALSEFIAGSRARYGFDEKVIAVGYSNGANIAAGLMLLYPRQLSGAMLFRAMVPFEPETSPDLTGIPVFIGSGRRDPIVPAANADRLAAILEAAGAGVTRHLHAGGHELGQDDIEQARLWLSQHAG